MHGVVLGQMFVFERESDEAVLIMHPAFVNGPDRPFLGVVQSTAGAFTARQGDRIRGIQRLERIES